MDDDIKESFRRRHLQVATCLVCVVVFLVGLRDFLGTVRMRHLTVFRGERAKRNCSQPVYGKRFFFGQELTDSRLRDFAADGQLLRLSPDMFSQSPECQNVTVEFLTVKGLQSSFDNSNPGHIIFLAKLLIFAIALVEDPKGSWTQQEVSDLRKSFSKRSAKQTSFCSLSSWCLFMSYVKITSTVLSQLSG